MSRHDIWRSIIDASTELDEKSARYADLDADGNLPPEALPTRTYAPQRETEWRALGGQDAGAAAASEPEPQTRSKEDRAMLEPLQKAARGRLETLWKELDGEPELGEADAFARIRAALAIHFDERILGRLPAHLRSSWIRLQTDYTGSSVGGEDFYRFVDQALVDRTQPSLVFEVYHFCLSHGFGGRHTNNTPQIDEYKRNLEGRIKFSPPSVARPTRPPNPSLREPWPARRYYTLVVVGALLYAALLTLWSNWELLSNTLVREVAKCERGNAESADASETSGSTGGPQ